MFYTCWCWHEKIHYSILFHNPVKATNVNKKTSETKEKEVKKKKKKQKGDGDEASTNPKNLDDEEDKDDVEDEYASEEAWEDEDNLTDDDLRIVNGYITLKYSYVGILS